MVDFDKFEKIVKNKYGNQEFPFDEQNWEKAAKMIDASRKGKNRGGIFLLSAVALLCTSGLVYYFGFSDSAKSLQKNDLAVNQVVTANENADNNNKPASENNSVVNAINFNEENIQSVNNVSSSNENAGSENTSSAYSPKIKTNPKSSISIKNSNASENISDAKSVNENGNSDSGNETKAETKTNTAPTSNANETKSNNSPGSEDKKTTPIKSNVKAITPPVLGSNSNASQNNVKPAASNTNPAETGNTERLGSTNDNSKTPAKNNTIIDSTDAIATAVAEPTESMVVDSVPSIRKSKADSLAAMQPKGDGISYATNVKEKHNAKNILFMEAGTTYLLGWNSGGKNEAGGFNLLAGVNFQHYFTGSIAAQIGIQYSTISNLTNTTHTIGTVNYDLGMEQDVTSIRYQKLHYVVAPLKVTYNAGDKNIIGVGCNIGYLLNSDSKKENYKTYSSDPNATKNNFTSTKESGYVQGFNPLDIQVGVSYRRKIYKGLSANAEFFYGLTDTKNNDFFKSNNFDRNVGFKVSLCYDLFKK
jgi:hypothetical protein